MAHPDHTLTLVAGGQRLTGWESVSVTRGIEIMPSSFEIGLTEKYPGQAADIVVKPSDPCVVLIGSDPVVTGYIDRYLPAIAPRQHTERIHGRSNCEELVDCSAGVYLGEHLSPPFRSRGGRRRCGADQRRRLGERVAGERADIHHRVLHGRSPRPSASRWRSSQRGRRGWVRLSTALMPPAWDAIKLIEGTALRPGPPTPEGFASGIRKDRRDRVDYV